MKSLVNLDSKDTVINDSNLLNDWIAYVGGSLETAKAYSVAVKRFWRFMQANNISTPTVDDLVAYRNEMERTLAPSSVKLNLAALRQFFGWLSLKGVCSNVAFGVKLSGRVAKETTHKRAALTAREAQKVLRMMPSDKSEKSLRDRCIMTIMFCCGLRSFEVCNLNVGSVKRIGRNYILQFRGKGQRNDSSKVILPASVYALIQDYLKLRGNVAGTAPLFVSTSRRCKGERLQPQSISRLAKAALVHAGFIGAEYCCHSCRHSFASIALDEKISVRDIQVSMRHSSVATTEIYLADRSFEQNPTTRRVASVILEGGIFSARTKRN